MDTPRSTGEPRGSENSLQEYFTHFMPLLENKVRRSFEPEADPTLDLESCLIKQVARHAETTNTKQHINTTSRPNNGPEGDSAAQELEVMVDQFRRKSNMSQKLGKCMLKGLEKTLAQETYGLFVRGHLPTNWLPIVRMNSDCSPYVEFLIKSDSSDQDPDSQLSDFTMSHITYSKFIVDQLREMACVPQLPNQTVPKKRRNCSTPLSERNDKRILPTRACKSKSLYL